MKQILFVLLLSSLSFSQSITGIIIGDVKVLKTPDLYEKSALTTLKNGDTIKIISVVGGDFYEIKKGEY